MLCLFIEKTSQLDAHGKPGPQLAMLAQSIFTVETAAIFDADLREVYWAGRSFDNLEDTLQSICMFETSSDDRDTGVIRRVLRIGTLPIGALLLRGETSPLVANAMAAVTSITFDRYHAFASESRTESARKTEQMRTMVLDSLAHAYKTPLTTIAAASSGLSAMGNLTTAQAELVTLIEEQADGLGRLTTRLLQTARLDISDLTPTLEAVVIAPLIDDVVASLRSQLSTFSITIALSRDDLTVRCDHNLLVMMLTHYLENVVKYAEAGTSVTIQAVEKANAMVLSVRNFGPVIPAGDCERVFDRYFRSSIHSNMASGTGIGLSVVKRAAQAQGGNAWVNSDEKQGTTFYIALPITRESDAFR